MAKSEPNTLAGLKRVFNKPDLDVNKFVSKVSKNGGAEILQTLTDLNRMTDEASAQMKRAIFNNFKLFIDASKAVTVLSTIMHQLDNQLVEQKRLCSGLAEKSLFLDGKSSNENKKSSKMIDDISSILSSVDGVSNLVKDSSRQLLFDADAIEVNPITYSKLGYFHLFVLSDFILVAKKQHDSYEMHRYKKQALYEIENVVVVDVKTTDSQKVAPLNLVQLLVFPDSRVFQMESTKVKRALISTIDEVKRLHLTVVPTDDLEVETEVNSVAESGGLNSDGLDSSSNRLASLVSVDTTPEVDTMCFEALAGTIPEIAHFIRRERPTTVSTTTTRVNPFQMDSFNMASPPMSLNEDAWLWEAPEDVDVAVAVRDFAKAARLISRARRRLAQLIPSDSNQQHQHSHVSAAALGLIKLKERVESRAANLSAVLQEELTRAADRYSATQSVHSAAIHLSELGKTVLALHLFLAYRSGVIGSSLVREVRQEGNQLIYLNRLSFVFHRGLVESVAEWNQLIEQLRKQPDFVGLDDAVTSKLCSWVLEETIRFCNQLKILLIDSRSISFYAMACASERIHAHAKKATELIGVDVTSTLDSCLLKSWQKAVEEQGRVYRDAVEHRASKENWRSSGNADANIKTIMEAGFPEAKQSLAGGKGDLSNFTTQTTRSLSHFAHACARFDCAELRECCASTLVNMLRGDLEVYSRSLASAKTQEESKTILVNLHFFTSKVIPKIASIMSCAENPAVIAVTKDFKKVLRANQN